MCASPLLAIFSVNKPFVFQIVHQEMYIWQEAQGLWPTAWSFARWIQHSFMDNGNVAEVTYNLQSAIYFQTLADHQKK